MYLRASVLFLLLFSMFAWSENPTPDKKVEGFREIVIHGNHAIDTSDYLDALGVEQKGWFEFWKDDKTLITKKAIPHISETLREFLDSKGYYDAKITTHNIGKRIVVTMAENKPVLVSSVDIKSDFNITHIVTFKKKGHFEAAKFVSVKKEIKKALMKAGYCNYKLDTKAYVDLDKRTAELKYDLHKGELCRFGETKIVSKPKNISDQVTLSSLQYKKGEVFSTEKINRTFDALNSLDAFDSGTLIITPTGKYGSEIGSSGIERFRI